MAVVEGSSFKTAAAFVPLVSVCQPVGSEAVFHSLAVPPLGSPLYSVPFTRARPTVPSPRSSSRSPADAALVAYSSESSPGKSMAERVEPVATVSKNIQTLLFIVGLSKSYP